MHPFFLGMLPRYLERLAVVMEAKEKSRRA